MPPSRPADETGDRGGQPGDQQRGVVGRDAVEQRVEFVKAQADRDGCRAVDGDAIHGRRDDRHPVALQDGDVAVDRAHRAAKPIGEGLRGLRALGYPGDDRLVALEHVISPGDPAAPCWGASGSSR